MMPIMELVMPSNAVAASSNVPAFLAKLWKMVDDPETNHMIEWNDEGNSFLIHNQAEFAQSLLPYYYKHSNMASFVRQLNMYGFHKVVGVDTGGLKSEKQEEMEFAHPYFLRGCEQFLDKIKRKVSTSKAAQFAPAMKSERVNEVLSEVSVIKDRQEDLDGKLDNMKKENEALWREVVSLRQKHQNQQKIVNKLIQFLVGIVQPRMGGPPAAVKRRFPNQLAIEDYKLDLSGIGGQVGNSEGPVIQDVTHEVRPSKNASGLRLNTSGAATITIPTTTANLEQLASLQQQLGNVSATIELPETPEAQKEPAQPIYVQQAPQQAPQAQPQQQTQQQQLLTVPAQNQQRQRSQSPLTAAMMAVDPNLVNPTFSNTVQRTAPTASAAASASNNGNSNGAGVSTEPSVATLLGTPPQKKKPNNMLTPTRPVLHREISREDFDAELSTMTKDLDNLKDMLSGQITLDPGLISSIFNPEEPMFANSDFPLQFEVNETPAAGASASVANVNVPAIENAAAPAPSLFELDDEDEVVDVVGSGDPEASPAKRARVDDLLQTPQVTLDQTNPLVFSLKK